MEHIRLTSLSNEAQRSSSKTVSAKMAENPRDICSRTNLGTLGLKNNPRPKEIFLDKFIPKSL